MSLAVNPRVSRFACAARAFADTDRAAGAGRSGRAVVAGVAVLVVFHINVRMNGQADGCPAYIGAADPAVLVRRREPMSGFGGFGVGPSWSKGRVAGGDHVGNPTGTFDGVDATRDAGARQKDQDGYDTEHDFTLAIRVYQREGY